MSQAGTSDVARFPHVDLLRPLRSDRFEAEETSAPGSDLPRADARALPGPATPARALAGEVEALYRRHNRLVFHLALRHGGGNTAWAEDVTQDVFLDLWKALPGLVDPDSLEGWLYRATTNRCFTRLRRERFLQLAPVRWLLGEQKPSPRLPDALTIARDDVRRAMGVLETLPLKERMAFSMYYLDEREQEEIGRILGHSKGYVSKLIQRAVTRVREAGWEVEDERAR